MTRIAVISDLHVGKHSRSRDLAPVGTIADFIDDDFQARFIEFLRKKGVKSNYVFIVGDVTESCSYEEAKVASKFIEKISACLAVPIDKIVFIPGNHDVDWGVLKLGKDPVRFAQRYDVIKFRELVFKDLMRPPDGLLEEPFIGHNVYDDLVVVTFNSSWHDGCDELMHFGRIESSHITALDALIQSLDGNRQKTRIFLLHHHPIAYSNPAPGEQDFSQLVNSEMLMNILCRHRFDLVVHGHIHQPRFGTHEIDASSPLGILSAGSLSYSLPTRWQGSVANQFHLIEIDGRDPESGCATGTVRSWAYYFTHGWIPSVAEHDGIGHIEPFGKYDGTDQVASFLRPVLSALLVKNSWISWEALVKAAPTLRYARPVRIVEAMDLLSSELHFRVHERQQADLEKIVLLREVP